MLTLLLSSVRQPPGPLFPLACLLLFPGMCPLCFTLANVSPFKHVLTLLHHLDPPGPPLRTCTGHISLRSEESKQQEQIMEEITLIALLAWNSVEK